MLAVYIILAVIFVLFITVIILAIRRYNNEEVSKELEYISENYDVNDINNETIENDMPTNEVKEEPIVEAAKVAEIKPALQEPAQPVDNTPPPVINIALPEQTDEEIAIVDTAIKEEATSESVEVKDNALKESEIGEEIKVVDNALKESESGEVAVTIKEDTPEPPKEVKPEVDYSNQAFGNNFDGNNSINKDIKVEEPKQDVSMKTEIWDFSEIQNGEQK